MMHFQIYQKYLCPDPSFGSEKKYMQRNVGLPVVGVIWHSVVKVYFCPDADQFQVFDCGVEKTCHWENGQSKHCHGLTLYLIIFHDFGAVGTLRPKALQRHQNRQKR